MTARLSALALLALSGCAGSLFESKTPAPQTYVISPAASAEEAAPQLKVDVSVSQPSAAPGLNTDRILLLRDGRRLDYYSRAQWGSQTARVMQYFVIASLQNQNLFRSVTSDDVRTSAPYVLDLELRDFQAEYRQPGAPPVVRVSIVASVMRVHDRTLLAVIPVSAVVPVTEDRMAPIVAAFEQASQQAASSLGTRIIKAIQDAPADASVPVARQ
jgi:cholesterol transport system auxiliary component